MRNSIVIIFILLLLGMFSMPIIKNIGDSQMEEYKQIEDLSVNAVATESSLLATTFSTDGVFAEEADRKKAIETFLATLGKNKGWQGNMEAAAYQHTPVIVLTDWDGFYLHYVEDGKEVSSDLIAWTETYESGNDAGFIVRYYLNDRIAVMSRQAYEDPDLTRINNTGTFLRDRDNKRYLRYEGNYADVAKEILADKDDYFLGAELPGVKFLLDKDAFEAERTRVISEAIEEKVNFLINENREYNIKGVAYTVNIPKADAYDRKHLRYPFVAAWTQGDQDSTLEGMNNSWAWTACEYEPLELYGISREGDTLIYHKEGCDKASEILNRLTMNEAAKFGAVPCECVYK